MFNKNREADMEARNILLIEDNNHYRLLLKKVLIREGFRVKSFENANKALDEINGNHLAPDVIISDLMMPQMDGLTFMEEIKDNQLLIHSKRIILSAKKNQRDIDHAYKLGCDLFLFKDIDLDILLDRIYELSNTEKVIQSHLTLLEPKECFNVSKIYFKNDLIHICSDSEVEIESTIRVKMNQLHREIICQVQEMKAKGNTYTLICSSYEKLHFQEDMDDHPLKLGLVTLK